MSLAFLGVQFNGFAQKITVSAINENRSTDDGYFSNRCEVTLRLSGDEMRKYKSLKISSVSSAVDEQGFDLLPEDYSPSFSDVSGNPTEVILSLNATSRKSSMIKSLAGEIVLLGPTEQNGGIVKSDISKIKGLKNLMPTTSGLGLVYITKENLDLLKEENESKRDKNIQTAAAASKGLAEELIKNIDEFLYVSWSDDQAIFFPTGDQSKLIDIKIQKKDGKMMDNNGSMRTGNLIVFYFSEAIDPASKVVIYNESDKSSKKVPFKFTNIDLP